MIVLDLVESDGIDGQKPSNDGEDTPPPAPKTTRKAPATPKERKEIKAQLTESEGQATELQISGLKTALKKLLELDPEQESLHRRRTYPVGTQPQHPPERPR
jgi:hypothetical protein